MIAEFVILSFATLIGWQLLKSVIWFRIPSRLANFVVPAISFTLTFFYVPSVVMALSAAGGCAVIFRFIDQDSVEPVRLSAIERRKSKRIGRDYARSNPNKNRVPPL